MYLTDLAIDGFRFIWAEAQFNFVWIKKARNMGQNITDLQGAKHAVIFSITCVPPFHTFLLAYLLLRFMMENIQLNNINVFEILNLTFRYHEHGVLGVMLFGSSFNSAFSHRVHQATNTTSGEYYFIDRTLCSRWIRPEVTWSDNGPLQRKEVIKLMKNTR